MGSAVYGRVEGDAINFLERRDQFPRETRSIASVQEGVSRPCLLLSNSGIMLKVSKVKTGNSHKFGMVLLEVGNMIMKP